MLFAMIHFVKTVSKIVALLCSDLPNIQETVREYSSLQQLAVYASHGLIPVLQ
jgi:hypothetical protein